MGFPSCICLSVPVAPFGLTVVPIQFCRRMNRNGGWQAYQIARLFAILITRVTIDDAVISIIIHVHTYVNAWSECESCAHRGKRRSGNFQRVISWVNGSTVHSGTKLSWWNTTSCVSLVWRAGLWSRRCGSRGYFKNF